MSGFFVHGGTQYPFGQTPSQQQQPSVGNQSYYGNTSYSSSQPVGQSSSNYSSSYSSSPAGNYGSSSTFSSNQRYGTSTTSSSNTFGSSSIITGSGFSSSTPNYSSSSNNYNSMQSSQTTFQKPLYSPTNQYYSNVSTIRGRGIGRGGGARGGQATRGRGRGGRGSFTQPQSVGPKPIKATEIKAFLYAWCGQRKLKPEYEVTTEGQPPKKVSFGCKLRITGLDYVAQVEASNKKDAQSKAAWDFCENLVKTGYMKLSELPPKPAEPAPKSTTGETTQHVGSLPPETSEEINQKGGWTLTNARQRLNQFCQREHTTPIFKHTTLGPEHARMFICTLDLKVSALQKEFVANERGNNKKQATSICALSMVRQLFDANLIEKFGEPIKHVTRGTLLGGKISKPIDSNAKSVKPGEENAQQGNQVAVTAGQKRKANDQPAPDSVDENGNWTVDNSRQRLNQFCQANNLPCDVIYEEEGQPGSRTYTASVNLKVKASDADEKELTASAKGQTKKVAAQSCALQLLSQLYKLTLVEANPNVSSIPNKKKQQRQRMEIPPPMRLPPYADYGYSFNAGMRMGSPHLTRRTPHLDLHITEKHKTIYPGESELAVIQRSVRTVEQALKEVSDQLVEPEQPAEKETEAKEGATETAKKRQLQSVLRVGALAKGLLLKGDRNVQLVLLCQETPTAKLLLKVAQLLPKLIKPVEGDSLVVETALQEAAITIINTTAKTETEPSLTCTITVSLTSPVVRNPTEEAGKDPPGSLNKEKCLQALAELRHAKWFQACASGLPSCVLVIRILREMKRRLLEWKSLSDWAIELIAAKSLVTSPVPLSLGGSFLRCIEAIASGVLLPDSIGISDPCERVEVDVTAHMTNQEREAVTTAAQNSVRLIVFRQPYKVLGMEQVEWSNPGRKAIETKEDGSKMET